MRSRRPKPRNCSASVGPPFVPPSSSLNLPAAGNGKARTFPRATIEALVLNKAKGCGPETINHYTSGRAWFFRWLVKAKRIGSNPLESLAACERRRGRAPHPPGTDGRPNWAGCSSPPAKRPDLPGACG